MKLDPSNTFMIMRACSKMLWRKYAATLAGDIAKPFLYWQKLG